MMVKYVVELLLFNVKVRYSIYVIKFGAMKVRKQELAIFSLCPVNFW